MTVLGHRATPAVWRATWLIVALATVLAAGALHASRAAAHASLLETAPANGATLDRAPQRVELTFNEPVEAQFGALRVVDAQGNRVDDGKTARPAKERISIGLRPGTPDGSYAATYRLVSADGHPIAGGITFVIGAPSPGGALDVARVVADGGAPPGIGTALAGARAVRYAGIAAVVGLVVLLVVGWRPLRRRESLSDPMDDALGRTADRWARRAAVLGALGVAATFVLQGANVAGTGVLPALRPTAWAEVAQTRTGLWLLIALALLLVLAVLLPRVGGALRAGRVGPLGLLAVAGVALLAATPAFGGHAAASHPVVVTVGLQVVHVAAMGAWLGGLMLLLLLLRTVGRATDESPLRTRVRVALLDGFGPIAITAVVALIVAGTVLSVIQLSAVRDLVDSAYGRAILLKALLTLAVVALAVVQRRRMVPQVRAARGTSSDAADRTVRRLLRAEIGLLLAVLVATGALAGYGQPGRPGVEASAAPVASGPVVREVTIDGRRLLRLEVDSGTVGVNTLTVRAIGIDGRPYARGEDLRVALTGPTEGQRLDPPMEQVGRGRWVAVGVPLAPAGTWRARIQLRTSAFDEDDVLLEVPVR